MYKFTALFVIALSAVAVPRGTSSRACTNPASVPDYDLTIKISPEDHRLEVSGVLTLPASSQSRPKLQLRLSDVMTGLRVEVLSPGVSAGSARLEPSPPEDKTVLWTIEPIKPIPAGDPVRLSFAYAGGGETRFVFYIGPEGSFAGGFNTAWYPQVLGNARAAGKMRFSTPSGYQVIATGKKLSQMEQDSRGGFAFEVTQPSMLSFAAARYVVERRTATGVSTAAYLLRSRPRIGDYLDRCARVIETLVREFGPNPYGDFSLVEVPAAQASSAGFAGASFEGFIFCIDDFLDQEFNTAYYGHEISHQWWGVSLGRKSDMRGRLMLDEAMAQYGSLRAVELLEGPRVAERYRRTGYPGYINTQNATGYFMAEAGGQDRPLSKLGDAPFDRILADGKGFIVYDMLARTIGREKFSRILQEIARTHAGGQIGWDEFLGAIEAGGGTDLKWFYQQWFERPGAPQWDVEWSQAAAAVRGVITQTAPEYRATLEILMEGEDYKTYSAMVELKGRRTEFSFPVDFRVLSVTLDPHFLVLNRTPAIRALRQAFAAVVQAGLERNAGHKDVAENILRAALAKQPEPDTCGAHFTIEVALGELLASQKKFPEAKAILQSALARAVRRESVLPRAFLYLAQAARGAGDDLTLRYAISGAEAAEAALGGDTGAASEARKLLSIDPK